MIESHILALTEQIYDAGVGGTPWLAVGQGLKALVGARTSAIMVGDVSAGRQEILYHAKIPDDAAAAYRQHFRKVDLWTNRAVQMAARRLADGRARVLVSGEMLVPDREFLRSEFYCDFGRPLGLRYVLGTVAPLGAAGVMPIGLHRPNGAAPFGDGERRLLEQVLPHLRRAAQLRHRLKGVEAAAGLAALDALPIGALVVDAELRVLVANLAAESLAARGAGLRLRREVGHGGGASVFARARRRADDDALAALVRSAALGGASGGALRLRDDDGAAALAALVAPLPRRLSGGPDGGGGRVVGQALVLLRDLSAAPAPPSPGLLRDLFGLTQAEAEVALSLAGGTPKRAVAAGRGSRESTVRTHVRAVLSKTGAANLRDLERVLAGLHGL